MRLWNEWRQRSEVWTFFNQDQFDARLLRSGVEFFLAMDDTVVDNFALLETANSEELKDPELYRYVARPTVIQSELQ